MTRDQTWIITDSPYPSPYLADSKRFGEKETCYLIDQYSGKRPYLITAELFDKKKIDLKFIPNVLFDTNLAGPLYNLANGGKVSDGFMELIRFLTKSNWTYSLYFYYLEHYCKTSHEDFTKNAVARTHALLTLHSMNDQAFLSSGEIIPNREAVSYYLDSSGEKTLEDVARHRVKDFCSLHEKSQHTYMVEAIEICLIKMFFIRRFELAKSTPAEQFASFQTFMKNDLGIVMGRESHLAIHYFYDKAGRLLGIQPNTPFERARSILKSTSWDMMLLRFPELFMAHDPEEVEITYLATQERELAHLAELFSVDAIIRTPEKRVLPLIGYSLKNLPPEAIELSESLGRASVDRVAIPAGLRDALLQELRRRLPG
ncbi:hypothetical protein V2K29_20215 [Pseudomonas alliivorans]|nr:hypothetical protein [Pseudomonas alliivorans]